MLIILSYLYFSKYHKELDTLVVTPISTYDKLPSTIIKNIYLKNFNEQGELIGTVKSEILYEYINLNYYSMNNVDLSIISGNTTWRVTGNIAETKDNKNIFHLRDNIILTNNNGTVIKASTLCFDNRNNRIYSQNKASVLMNGIEIEINQLNAVLNNDLLNMNQPN